MFNEKVQVIFWSSRVSQKQLIANLRPDGQAYAVTLLKDESHPYGSYSLYRALVLTTTQGKAYSGPRPDGYPFSGSLLKDGGSPNGLQRVLTLTAKPARRLS